MELVLIGITGQAVALTAMLLLAGRGPGQFQALRIHLDGREEPVETNGPDSQRVRLLRRWLAAFVVATAVATAGATSL